jgi:hypothetical protein
VWEARVGLPTVLRSLSLGALASIFFACGGPPEEELIEDSSPIPMGPATIRFERDWQVLQTGTLFSGSRAHIVYDEERLATCRGFISEGRPGWGVTAHWSLNGGPAGSAVIAGLDPNGSRVATGEIDVELEGAGDLAVWFEATSAWGCHAWDSSFGANYHFRVEPPAAGILRFDAAWRTRRTGPVRRGSGLAIEYDPTRLQACRATTHGYALWDIVVQYRFDGGPVSEATLTLPNGPERVALPAYIQVPSEARALELWFENHDRAGCRAWDSKFGANYRFTTSPADTPSPLDPR